MTRWSQVIVLALIWTPAASGHAQDAPPEDELDSAFHLEDPPEVDDFARARELFSRGVELTREQRFGEALEYFRRSRALVERPNTVYNMAGILLRMGRGTEAVDAYEHYLELAEDDDPDRGAAERSLAAARASIASLDLIVDPHDAVVRVDGRLVDGSGPARHLLLDPGRRVLQVSSEGFVPAVLTISALPGAFGEREVTLEPDSAHHPPPDPEEDDAPVASEGRVRRSPQRVAPPFDDTAPHFLLALGAPIAAVGAALLAVAIHDRSAVENAERNSTWNEIRDAYDRTRWMTPLSASLLGLGGLAAALGSGWLLGTSIGLVVDAASARLHVAGRF